MTLGKLADELSNRIHHQVPKRNIISKVSWDIYSDSLYVILETLYGLDISLSKAPKLNAASLYRF